jgi:hypothetical protein
MDLLCHGQTGRQKDTNLKGQPQRRQVQDSAPPDERRDASIVVGRGPEGGRPKGVKFKR